MCVEIVLTGESFTTVSCLAAEWVGMKHVMIPGWVLEKGKRVMIGILPKLLHSLEKYTWLVGA